MRHGYPRTGMQAWCLLHENGNLEDSPGGWWNFAVLEIAGQDAFLEA